MAGHISPNPSNIIRITGTEGQNFVDRFGKVRGTGEFHSGDGVSIESVNNFSSLAERKQ